MDLQNTVNDYGFTEYSNNILQSIQSPPGISDITMDNNQITSTFNDQIQKINVKKVNSSTITHLANINNDSDAACGESS